MTDLAPAEFDDFRGGFTDTYLNGPPLQFRRGENLLLVQYGEVGKLLTRPGSDIYDATNPQIPAGNQRIGALKIFDDTLLVHSKRDFYYINGGVFVSATGPTGNLVFPPTVTTDVVPGMAEWNHHLFVTSSDYTSPQKIYLDGGGSLKLRTAGMPALASAPTIIPTAGAGIYLYRFLHFFTYQVGTLTFVDRGATTLVTVTAAAIVGSNAISAIPVLANGTTQNYDTATVKIEIYRTTFNGQVFYKAGEVTNGTTIFTDTMLDATLLLQPRLYTEGGEVENDTPPLSQVVHVTESTGYYAPVMEGAEIRLNRLRQSKISDIDSCPATFFTDVDDDIIGLSSVHGSPVLLCKRSAYRIDGRFDDFGRGGMISQKISDTCTCVGPLSVVQTLDGVFWWGDDAIYFTDGYKVIPINTHWPDTHKLYTQNAAQRRRLTGAYDKKLHRIWWSVQTTTEVDATIVLDLNWGIHREMPFTRLGNGSLSWAPTAMEFLDGNLIRGDSRGYLFQHADTLYSDPKIDTAVAAASWGREAILYDFESCATNFGSNYERKYIPRISVQCKNLTNLSLQIVSNNDDGKKIADLKPIRYRGNIVWGDPTVIWGDPDIIWNESGVIEEWRWFPANNLRCSYKAIQMTNAFVVIANSDLFGGTDINSTLKTATLVNFATMDWPSASVDYYIAFEANWDVEYKILSMTADVITFEDLSNTSATASDQAWEIRGIPKDEAFYLISYTIHFAQYGKTQNTFTTAEAGSIAT